jgi:hypothetical protein
VETITPHGDALPSFPMPAKSMQVQSHLQKGDAIPYREWTYVGSLPKDRLVLIPPIVATIL